MKRVVCMYFSPTHTTQKVVEMMGKTLAEILGVEKCTWDFTPKKKRRGALPNFSQEDVLILGTPVIAGRVPNVLLKYLDALQGQGTMAIPVVLYGNRHYDDALIELGDILKDRGFILRGAAAFIGEHSFSKILAAGRPTKEDLEEASSFAKKIGEKILVGEDVEIQIPGTPKPYRPYYRPKDKEEKPADIRKVHPIVHMDLCIDCKVCAKVCPMESISYEDVSQMIGICIKCGACEKSCPTGARYYDDEVYLKHRRELEEEFPMHKENLTIG